ncbi:HNH endonuclease [Bradyrhizobium sp. PMVTL-01]|uniref:HNH endonuclease n=1 Tax=Bradyrhizobium sp. PMVTL-01 TaxID=3434999 RepID=UPI003F716078
MRKSPHRRVLWYDGMPDSESRECQYCGTLFVPDLGREIAIPAAPPSVLAAHRRAHCSEYCDYGLTYGLRPIALNRMAIFERDGFRCYLCGQPTPKDFGSSRYAPNAPSVDHVVPQILGTDDPDNLRCCCRRCNTEKLNSTLWEKLAHLLLPELNFFPAVLLRVLPRRPILSELIPFWRELLICDGEPVEDRKQDGFVRLYNLLLISKDGDAKR